METKERPILFTWEMVRAILEGRKTQTRRVIKFKQEPDEPRAHRIWWCSGTHWQDGDEPIRCPYGEPGDRLWVRETIHVHSFGAGTAEITYDAGGTKANPYTKRIVSDYKIPDRLGAIPSIHMPKHCARIFLDVKSVRVERIQDITIQDIVAEGVRIQTYEDQPLLRASGPFPPLQYLPKEKETRNEESFLKAEWISLWETINHARGFGWDVNPWVWVVEFERVDDV
jgi:hypothetical protein